MALNEVMKERKPQEPPNLRRGNARRRCGTCTHFSSNHRHGMCRKYHWAVEASQLCDSYSPAQAGA